MINKKIKTSLFISTFLLYGIGAILHFVYNFSNNNFLIGLITPVNESIFEHLKLSVFPILMYWLVFYFCKKKKYSLDPSKWFYGCLVSMITSVIVILSVHYVFRYSLGTKVPIIDILSLYFGILIGRFMGYKVYLKKHEPNINIVIFLIITFITSFFILTIRPFKIPLFEDSKTKTYGIFKITK